MKTILLVLLLIAFSDVFAQSKSIKPKEFKKLNFIGKTSPLKNIYPVKTGGIYEEKPELEDHKGKIGQDYIYQNDPVIQNKFVKNDSIPIMLNFDGVGCTGMPNPDTDGDVGPDHFFQMVKSSFAIWDKQGNLLYGPAENKTIWSEFPGPWQDYNWTDPIVVYDHLTDRWLASAMVYDLYNEYYEMIAVSATPDPLGEWYCYSLWFDVMPDYPKFGMWPDGYYLTINEWYISASYIEFEGASILVFNPEELINGIADPTVIYFHFDAPGGSTLPDISSFQPSDLDGNPPPQGTPNYHICVKDNTWGFPEDRLWIWACSVDWNDTSNCVFSETGILETEPFNAHIGNAFIHQPETSTRLQALSQFMMYRLQYRNFENYQSLVCNHTVDVDGNDHGSVRWYELRNEGDGWYIYQQSTFAPDEESRWMGSMAMDADGNIGLGYSVSGDSVFPGIKVTGRRLNDDPGMMTMFESEIATGAGNQGYNERWGDYSLMTVDPVDDLTFWYTQEYLPGYGPLVWQTKIASFQLHKNLSPSDDSLVFVTVDDCINGKQVALKNNSSYNVLIDEIEEEGWFNNANWYIDPFNYNFPLELIPGDSIVLNVFVKLPVGSITEDFLTDTLDIYTGYKNYSIVLQLNEGLISRYNDYFSDNNYDLFTYPNPFTSGTTIEIILNKNLSVYLDICNAEGRRIKNILEGKILKKGIYKYDWDGFDDFGQELPDGIYFIRLKTGGNEIINKVVKK